MANKKALILGVLGQMGSYMAELLNSKGYDVYGIVRLDADQKRVDWIKSLVPNIHIAPVDVLDKLSVQTAINIIRPNEIYNFCGYTNTFDPWKDIELVMKLNAKLPQDILESIVAVDKSIKFFQSSSCLVFGRDKSGLQNESTPRSPLHIYGSAKNYADNAIISFRETFGLFACSGILFPTESPRRGEEFFTKKVCKAIAEIKSGVKKDKLRLGDLTRMRDWSWAPDVVEAIYLMMQAEKPDDYVIGSGVLTSPEYFMRTAFEYAKLDYLDYLEHSSEFDRKKDMWALCANNRKIKLELKWQPKINICQIIEKMIDFEVNLLKK